MRKHLSENKCDETVKTIGEQSSLSIFTQKYLHKCEDTYFIFQNKYLRNYKDSFGVKLLRDDCNLSMFLLTYTCQNQLHMLSYG